MDATTDYATICDILGEVWVTYGDDSDFAQFVSYNDLGLPLAYAIAEGIIQTAPMAEEYIMETWAMFLEALGLEDTGWEDLQDMLEAAVTEM